VSATAIASLENPKAYLGKKDVTINHLKMLHGLSVEQRFYGHPVQN
jgi:hypothetical protein